MKKSLLKETIIISLILFIIVSKQIRFIPSFQFLWNFPYVCMGLIMVLGLILLLNKRKYNYLDIIIIVFNLFLFIASIIRSDTIMYISIYILPISGYYMFRTQLANKLDIFKLLFACTYLVSSFVILEFVTENFSSFKIFDYENASIENIKQGSVYGGNRYDKKYNPIVNILLSQKRLFERPLGASMSVQGSAALIAGLGLFVLTFIKNNRKRYYAINKYYKSALLLTIVSLVMTMSGTGLFIFIIGAQLILFDNRYRFIGILLLPISIYLVLLIRGYQNLMIWLWKYILFLFYKFTNYVENNIFSWEIYFGTGPELQLDIDYLSFPSKIGFIGIGLFILLLIKVKSYNSKLISLSKDHKSLMAIIISILVANFHYDSIFRFPMSFIFFMIIGYISNKIYISGSRKYNLFNRVRP
tara:strand:+ start:32927 stop:34171 length:1245 start_codon:yes stop_codon:yes gene_type:complete